MPTTLMELRHADMEHRMFITILSLAQLGSMVNQSMLILQTPEAMVAKAAIMTGWPTGIVAGVFAFCAILVLPNTFMTLLWKNRFANRTIVKLAVIGFALCSATWLFLAYSARNLDAEWLTVAYLEQGMAAMAFSAALGVMLNNQMKRRLRVVQLENEKQPSIA